MRRLLILLSLSLFVASAYSDEVMKKSDGTTKNGPTIVKKRADESKNKKKTAAIEAAKAKEIKAKALEKEKADTNAREQEHLRYEGRTTEATEKISGFNFGLIIVGVIQAAVLALQSCLLWGTLNATKTAANAARDAADALPKIERAYLFLEGASFSTTHSTIQSIRDAKGNLSQIHLCGVDLRFKNHGKTPGIVKEVFATVKSSPVSSEWGEARECSLEPIRTVSADRTFTAVSHQFAISHTDYESTQRTGTPYILVFGMIVYQNVLKRECWTKFCWRFSFREGGWRPTIDPQHNDWS